MLKPQPYKLINSIQHYEWGTKGKNAFIPKLLSIKPEKDKPYAELWMGAHPKAPSRIVINGKELTIDEIIRQYPKEMLGNKNDKRFSNKLPFLFKVLSANEALSIQVHPNKKQAIVLHKKDPADYPDPNQKLEIAIALDSLTALVGFEPFNQIIKTLKEYHEIQDFIGGSSWFISEKRKYIKRIFTKLIKKSVSDEEALATTIRKLKNRLSKKKNQTEIEVHFLELFVKYKNDIGLLILFFLNLVHLKRGEAIFTKPGIPHAYLEGNILECMSNSDNVIRAGLTSKFKDAKTLLKVLTYDLAPPKILKGRKKGNTVVYKTDAKEFELQIISLEKKVMKFENQSGPRIMFILEGGLRFLFSDNGKILLKEFAKGDSIFLPSILSNYKISSKSTSRFVLVSVLA